MSIVGAAKYIPALARGHKIYPQHIAGMLGLPYVGDIWYVDPNSGSDANNSGESQDDALATVAAAEDKATAGQNDVILLTPTATTGRTTETSTITWDKDYTHLVGVAAPVMINTRAGMSASTSVSPLITISADGCIFSNLTIATFNDNDGLVNVTGSRNRFENVHFAGMGNQTTADTDTTPYCVQLNGGGEHYFVNCVFGLDTVERAGNNANLLLDGGTARNIFDACIFNAAVDDTDPSFVKAADASAADRFHLFRGCAFITFSTNEGTAMAEAFEIPASPQTHRYILQDCIGVDGAGTLDWDSNNRGDLFANMPSAAASAAGGIATSQ